MPLASRDWRPGRPFVAVVLPLLIVQVRVDRIGDGLVSASASVLRAYVSGPGHSPPVYSALLSSGNAEGADW